MGAPCRSTSNPSCWLRFATPRNGSGRSMPNALIDPTHDPRRVTTAIAGASSVLAVLMGVLVWAGWLFHIERLTAPLPGTPQMAASTASCFILCGLALWWQRRPIAPRPRAIAVSAAAFVIALLVVAEYLLPGLSSRGTWAEVANLLPGQMALGTAVNFVLLATGIR